VGHFPGNLSDSIIIFFIHLLVNLFISFVLQIPKLNTIIIIEYFKLYHLPTIPKHIILPHFTLATYSMQQWPIKILDESDYISSLCKDILGICLFFLHFLIVHDEVHVALRHIFINGTYHLCISRIVSNRRCCLIDLQGFFYL